MAWGPERWHSSLFMVIVWMIREKKCILLVLLDTEMCAEYNRWKNKLLLKAIIPKFSFINLLLYIDIFFWQSLYILSYQHSFVNRDTFSLMNISDFTFTCTVYDCNKHPTQHWNQIGARFWGFSLQLAVSSWSSAK